MLLLTATPVAEVALLQRERDLPQKQVLGGKQQSLAYVRATSDL